MAKTYQNTIPNSPITKVEIEFKGISLYRQSDQKQYFHNIKTIYAVLDHIQTNTNTYPVTQEIYDAINNWHVTNIINYIKWIEEGASAAYLKMQDIIAAQWQKAQKEEKKLLVILGENHRTMDPHLFQLFALEICQKIGIKDLLIESNSMRPWIKAPFEILSSHYINNKF